MFEPKFTYTDKIVNYIAEIASAKEVISNAKIIPVYDTKLKQDALIRSSHYSTSIEGNPLNLDEVETLIKNNQKLKLKLTKLIILVLKI